MVQKNIGMTQQFIILSMIYSAINLFSWYSTHLFFRDISVINEENVPKEGATIIYGNHNNQFVDGMLLMNVIKRPISFIAAAKSCKRPIVGDIIRGTGAIPVERPQDLTYKGQGTILQAKDKIITGKDTKFTKLTKGCSVQISNKTTIVVSDIISDTQLKTSSLVQDFQGEESYKVTPKIEYNDLYAKVWQSLRDGKCIGIYPQGGSHDRMELLPLKAGICIMALGAMDKYNIPVKLVPCGFNYYNPQKFRSKAILQFGPTYEIPQEMLELYRMDKRKAIALLLQNVQKMLKAVTIQFKSYNQLNALFLSRELYALSGKRQISIKEKLQLNRRFAKGYTVMIQNPEYKEIHKKLLKFSELVSLSGFPIKKQDFLGSRLVDFIKLLYYSSKYVTRSLIALPGIIMFAPTTSIITYLSEKERLKCLKGSKVKQYGNDVVGSYKILLSSFLLPLTCAIHSGILYFLLKKFSQLQNKTILKAAIGLFCLQPIYALLFVKSYDSIKKSWKKLKYLFRRTFYPNVYTEFNREKKQIQKKIIQVVNKLGEEVFENFHENRVLKKEEVQVSQSQLYIFDEDQQK